MLPNTTCLNLHITGPVCGPAVCRCAKSVSVPCACCAYLVVVPLDDLQEHRGTVLQGLGEDLQQVAVVIIVNQDFQLLKLKSREQSGEERRVISYKQAVL